MNFIIMAVLLIIMIILALILLGVALLKVRIVIDTVDEEYIVQVVPLGRMQLTVDDGRIGYEWKALFFGGSGKIWPRDVEPEDKEEKEIEKAPSKKERERKPLSKKKRSRMKMDRAQMMQLGRSLWKGLRVNRFRLRLNTDDPVRNAWLFPAFWYWRSKGYDVAIQWSGATELTLEIEHTVYRVAGAFIYTYLKPKNNVNQRK